MMQVGEGESETIALAAEMQECLRCAMTKKRAVSHNH